MKSILAIGDALTDILALLPDDSLLKKYDLPVGGMKPVDMSTGDEIWEALKRLGVKYVPGGAAANTIACTSAFGMKSCFMGKIGKDDLGEIFKSTMEQYGVDTTMLYGEKSSGRCMTFVTQTNAERTFANYMGAATEFHADDIQEDFFKGYDYFYLEGYLARDPELAMKALDFAKKQGSTILMDLASYGVILANESLFHEIVRNYADIVFANEAEAKAFTGLEPREALDKIATMCDIAVVKIGKDGSMVKSGDEYHFINAWPAEALDATAAGDTYAAGFTYAHSLGMPLEICGKVGSIIASKVVEVVGSKIDARRWAEARDEIAALMATVQNG